MMGWEGVKDTVMGSFKVLYRYPLKGSEENLANYSGIQFVGPRFVVGPPELGLPFCDVRNTSISFGESWVIAFHDVGVMGEGKWVKRDGF
jgi:hypothetical protein